MTELAYELQPQPEAGQHIRQALGEHLRGHVPDDLLEDLFAVVTELVNNSVLYGPGEPIQVELTIAQDGRLRGEVTDHGDGDVAIRAISDDRGGGLGLLIVDALADHWGGARGQHNGLVRVVGDIGRPREAAPHLDVLGGNGAFDRRAVRG